MKKRKCKEIDLTIRLKDLNDKITKNDEVYQIKEFAKQLDLSLLDQTLSQSGRGPYPLPLYVPVGIWMFGYKNGVLEYRDLSDLCKKHDDYYWISEGFMPSGSYLESWKLKILPLMPMYASQYQDYLREHGEMETEYAGLDGCKVDCWASLKQSKTESQIDFEVTSIEIKHGYTLIEEKIIQDLETEAQLLTQSDSLSPLEERMEILASASTKELLEQKRMYALDLIIDQLGRFPESKPCQQFLSAYADQLRLTSESEAQSWFLTHLPQVIEDLPQSSFLKRLQSDLDQFTCSSHQILEEDRLLMYLTRYIETTAINPELSTLNQRLDQVSNQKKRRSLEKRRAKLLDRKNQLQQLKLSSLTLSDEEKKKLRINITSPDTVILHRRDHQVIQGINMQGLVNQNLMILFVLGFSKSTDTGLLGTVYNKMCDLLMVSVLGFILLADSGYWFLKDVLRFDPACGYKILLPSTSEVAAERNKKGGRKGSGWGFSDGFKYDKERDVIVCPDEKDLTFKSLQEDRYACYHASSKDCQGCQNKNACLGNIKGTCKKLSITKVSDIEVRLNKYYLDHQELYKRRGVLNEPIHAHMFSNRGIKKLHTLAGPCIQGELALIALITTLERVHKDHGSYLPFGPFRGFLFFMLLITVGNAGFRWKNLRKYGFLALFCGYAIS